MHGYSRGMTFCSEQGAPIGALLLQVQLFVSQ